MGKVAFKRFNQNANFELGVLVYGERLLMALNTESQIKGKKYGGQGRGKLFSMNCNSSCFTWLTTRRVMVPK